MANESQSIETIKDGTPAQQTSGTNSQPKEKKKKSHPIRTFLIGFFIGVIVVVGVQFSGALTAIGLMNAAKPTETVTINSQTLVNELKEVEELSSLSFKYTNYTEVNESNEVNGIQLPLTSHEFLLIYGGEIKLGVDMSQSNVQVNGNKVTVTLPKSKVLSDEIDEDSVRYYDLKNEIFNQIQWEDRQAARKELKKKTKESAQMAENLEKADESARNSVKAFCEALVPAGYSVEVITSEE